VKANYNLKKFFDNQRADRIWRDRFIEDILRDHLDNPYEVDGVVYANRKTTGERVQVDLITWNLYNGELPDGYTLKHIDGDCWNNKLSNLRKEKIKK